MLKTIFFISSFFIFTYINAQIAIQPHLVFPTGYLGAVLKKSPGLSIGKMPEFGNKWNTSRFRFMGDLIYFIPKEEEFDNIYAVQHEGSNTTVYPGREDIQLYMNIAFNIGYEFRFVEVGNFNFYGGVDLGLGMTLRKLELNVPNVIQESSFDGILYIGVGGVTGVEYLMENSAIFIDFRRKYYLNLEAFILDYNDIGLGIRFNLKH